MSSSFRAEVYLRSLAYWHNLRHGRASFRPIVFVSTAVFFLLTLSYTILPLGSFSSFLPGFSIWERPTSPAEWAERARSVKGAFAHAYHGYDVYASPHDELTPLTNRSSDKFNGWGVTLYDSLDTMYIMGFDEEFQHALLLVEKANFSLKKGKFAPFFETVIRYLGGLLSAYALSKEHVLLVKAEEMADRLSPIFNTSSGFPLFEVDTVGGISQGPNIGVLAEIASLQLEYTYLAHVSGSKEHHDKAANVIDRLASADLRKVGGMLPKGWNLTSGQPHDAVMSVGAAADSGHEYLLKQFLLSGKTDKVNLEMYLRFTTYVLTKLIYLSPHRHLVYVTDRTIPYINPSNVFEHLSCFLPGLLALGASTIPLDNLPSLGIDYLRLSDNLDHESRQSYLRLSKYNLTELHMWAAKGIGETCYMLYADQPTGLAPDEVLFSQGGVYWMDVVDEWNQGGRAGGVPPGLEQDKKPIIISERERLKGTYKSELKDYGVLKGEYLLRPETIESLYMLWRTTGDVRWREHGWTIFKAIEKQTKTSSGYASLATVENAISVKKDDMPSYFLAETLKYLYLMFLDDDPISLDRWVFNTEGHPLPVIRWTEAEKQKFGIKY